MAYRKQISILNMISILVGLWLIFSPFVLGYQSQAVLGNSIVVGILVVGITSLKMFMPRQVSSWMSGIDFVLGAWLIVSPFILDYFDAVHTWNSLILGLVLASLSIWSWKIPVFTRTRHIGTMRHA